MNVLCVDDERLALEALTEAVNEVLPQASIFPFRSGQEALALAEQTPIDVAFLDIEMRAMNGLQLAKELKELCKTTNIVFTTGYEDYALDAFGVNASGYLMKPISPQGVQTAMDNLRNPVSTMSPSALRVQCFGNFEVFFQNTPLVFRYAKTKELLAYLVDRKGAAISPGELIAVLWEDEKVTESMKSQLRNLLSDLKHTLREHGVEDVLKKANRCFAVDTERLDCDYYGFMHSEAWAINAYYGEYMSQYSWAEMTLGALGLYEK